MKITEAKEILNHMLVEPHPKWNPDNFDAIKLGIRFLDRIEWMRKLDYPEALSTLPGETEE